MRKPVSFARTISYVAIAAAALNLAPASARACGGFFCQQIPINQTAEQIIFHQDGDEITAAVLIQYVGLAEDFSWVVPVPGIPSLSTGSDLVFRSLEPATRPQFTLEIIEPACFLDQPLIEVPAAFGNEDAGAVSDDVTIVDELTVGPFDVQIVTSDDANALATWLTENGYDLTDRGPELIAPYVADGMNFVALKLQQDKGVGDLQPLIMRYQSDRPMVPLRLTAVASINNMGVIVWVLGESRAVPINYLHVEPNYTLLDWYAGQFAAYASYQNLITMAMNEAGGRGFATDYAGRDLNLNAILPSSTQMTLELEQLEMIEDDADYVVALASSIVLPQPNVQSILQRELPLEGKSPSIYLSVGQVQLIFTEEELVAARPLIQQSLIETIIRPLDETLALFDGGPYMTRLFTTLSPEEMTVDPVFDFVDNLEDQPLERRATLTGACAGGSVRWSLRLGAGTGREGELVVEGNGTIPLGGPAISQSAVWRTQSFAELSSDTITDNDFPVVTVGNRFRLCGSGAGMLGVGVVGLLALKLVGPRNIRPSSGRAA